MQKALENGQHNGESLFDTMYKYNYIYRSDAS